jgi:hypothetical protein
MKPAGYSSACRGDPSAERTDQAWQKRPSSGAKKRPLLTPRTTPLLETTVFFNVFFHQQSHAQSVSFASYIHTHTYIYQDVINIRVLFI